MKNEVLAMQEIEDRKNLDRKLEKEENMKYIQNVKKDVTFFKQCLKNFHKNADYLNKIKEQTEKIEKKIGQFKEKQMNEYDNLIEEEETLYHEIMLMNEKLESNETFTEHSEVSKLNLQTNVKRAKTA